MHDPPPSPPTDDQALLDYVAHREVPCPRCAYNLRGLTRPVCPECGNALRLTVGTVSPLSKAWLMLIVGLLVPSGIGAVSCIGLGIAMSYGGNVFSEIRSMEEFIGMMSILYTIACIPLSGIAIGTRKHFMRLGINTQWVLASIPAVIDVSIMIFFLSLL